MHSEFLELLLLILFQDNHELFAMMEKTRMYIFRSLDPEVTIAPDMVLFSAKNEALLMSTHNICFCPEIKKNYCVDTPSYL